MFVPKNFRFNVARFYFNLFVFDSNVFFEADKENFLPLRGTHEGAYFNDAANLLKF